MSKFILEFFLFILLLHDFTCEAQSQLPQSTLIGDKISKPIYDKVKPLPDFSFTKTHKGKAIYNNYLKHTAKKTDAFNKRIERTNRKYLKEYFKQENKLFNKLCKVNPALADHLFSLSNDPLFYHQKDIVGNSLLKNRSASNEYFPQYDSLKTSIDYFKRDNTNQTAMDSLKVNKAWEKMEKLDTNLISSAKLQQYFRGRKLTFNESLKGYPDLKSNCIELDKVNYYYHEQIKEYKNIFGDFSSVDEKALEILRANSDFKKLIADNGQLSVFSKIPQDWGKDISELQTIAQTKGSINENIKGLGLDAKNIIKKNMEPMSSSLSKLKSGNYGSVSNAADVPAFKPSPLKTKRFADRLEFGNNFQISHSNYAFPATVTLGMQAGYKISSRIKPGIGISYNLGMGTGWNDINFSQQGIGLRSFVDFRISNILYLESGYERNTIPPSTPKKELGIKNWEWREVALTGIKLKYGVKGVFNPTMSFQYDFLHDKYNPPNPSFVYRVGWEFGK